MASITSSRFHTYNGSVINHYTGLLNTSLLNGGSPVGTATLQDPNGFLSQSDDAGATFTLGGTTGNVEFLGSGTVATLSILGIQLDSRPVSAFSVNGQIYLYAPQGLPLLSSISIAFNIDPNGTLTFPVSPDGFVDGTDGADHMALGYTDAQGDKITTNSDTIYGGAGSDTISGYAGNARIFGGDGGDWVYGGAGNDYIDAGAGVDNIYGSTGDDTIIGTLGTAGGGEIMDGGDDADDFIITPDAAGAPLGAIYNISGQSGGIDNDTLDLTALISDGWVITSTALATDGQEGPAVAGEPGFNGSIFLSKPGQNNIIININDIERIIAG